MKIRRTSRQPTVGTLNPTSFSSPPPNSNLDHGPPLAPSVREPPLNSGAFISKSFGIHHSFRNDFIFTLSPSTTGSCNGINSGIFAGDPDGTKSCSYH